MQETERLARIEEQVIGVREDIGEMKMSLKTATDIMGQLHVQFVPRTEIEKQISLRDKAEEEQNRRIFGLERDVEKLNLWRSWLTGAIGVLVVLFVSFFEYGKQWFGGGNH